MDDDPLMFALELTRTHNRDMSCHINELIASSDSIADGTRTLHACVIRSDGTRYQTYCNINPALTVHDVYNKRQYAPELYRTSLTRMRLSSHRLKIETGRWSRLSREHRLCQCGQIQDERHVLQFCPLVEHIRTCYNKPVTFPAILAERSESGDMKFIHDVTCFFQ